MDLGWMEYGVPAGAFAVALAAIGYSALIANRFQKRYLKPRRQNERTEQPFSVVLAWRASAQPKPH